MPRFKKPKLGRHQYLADCFGEGNPRLRAECPCPPACKRACARARLTDRNNPRVVSSYRGLREYTPQLNALSRSWGPNVRRPSRGVKLCYLGLVSYLRSGCRWVLEHTDILAGELEFTTKAFTKYCGILEEEYGLIERYPMREVSPFDRSNRMVILMCDLPEWFPGYLTEAEVTAALASGDERDRFEDEEDFSDDGRDLDVLDLDEDDDREVEDDDGEMEDDGSDLDVDEDEIDEAPVAPRSKWTKRGPQR